MKRTGLFQDRISDLIMTQIQKGVMRLSMFVWLVVASQAGGQVVRGGYRMESTNDSSQPTVSSTIREWPPEITLNGLTTILGDKSALFKVRHDYGGMESYFLAEGQSAGEIQLLYVDIKNGSIKVSNHGVFQIISMSKPPDLSTLVAPAGKNGNSIADRQDYGRTFEAGSSLPNSESAVGTVGHDSSVAGQTYHGTPIGGASASQNAGTASNDANGTASNDPNVSAGDATAPNVAQDNAGIPKGIPNNLRAAREFEQLRIQTANAVYDGIDEPLPLTPLTPAGTPMALIGTDKAWFPD
jgi:hypothetical protein